MYNKNQQLLVYIIKNYNNSSITSLMKLCYLVDLVSINKKKPQISSFEYQRYKFGPFDNKIYKELELLVNDNIVSQESDYTPKGDEYIEYKFRAEDFEFNKLSSSEKSIIDEVLDNLSGYGAKVLTQIAYKTKPMKALGATFGGNENLNQKLNLEAK